MYLENVGNFIREMKKHNIHKSIDTTHIYLHTHDCENGWERVPRGRSIGTDERGRAIVHMPLPIPNHPETVEYHSNPSHTNHRIHQLQQRLHAAPQHSPHFRIAQLIVVG